MKQNQSLTIVELLCHLSRRLCELRASGDHERLRAFWGAITVVLEVAYHCEDRKTATLLEEMSDAVRDSLMDVDWKSTIPSEDAIRKLYDTQLE